MVLRIAPRPWSERCLVVDVVIHMRAGAADIGGLAPGNMAPRPGVRTRGVMNAGLGIHRGGRRGMRRFRGGLLTTQAAEGHPVARRNLNSEVLNLGHVVTCPKSDDGGRAGIFARRAIDRRPGCPVVHCPKHGRWQGRRRQCFRCSAIPRHSAACPIGFPLPRLPAPARWPSLRP